MMVARRFFSFTLLLFGFVRYVNAENNSSILVRRIHGVSLVEVRRPDAIYETLLPAVFIVKLPEVYPEKMPNVSCNLKDFRCLILQKQHDLDSEISTMELAAQTKRTKANRSRNKRQILAGLALAVGGMYAISHWGSGPSSDDIAVLTASDDVIKAHVKSLELAEEKRAKQLALVQKDLKFIAHHQEQFENAFVLGLETAQNETRALFSLQLRLLDYIRYMELMNSCRLRLIPEEVISVSTMRTALRKIRIKAAQHGLVPTISIDDVMTMYSKPVVRCVFSEKQVLITVQIPMRRREDTIKLYRVTPIIFQYNSDVCHIEANMDYAAVVGKKVYSVKNADCDLSKGMCKVGVGAPALSTDCIYNLINKGSVEDLMFKCAYKCTQTDFGTPYVTRVEHITYVANTKEMNITCANKTYSYSANGTGALEVILSEKCFIQIEGYGLILPMYPTISEEDLESDHVVHLSVPAGWSKDKSAISSDPAIFKDLRNLIDTNWPQKLKVFNLTADDFKVDFPGWKDISPQYMYHLMSGNLYSMIFYIFLAFLTLFVIFLWRRMLHFEAESRNRTRRTRDMIPLRERLFNRA